MPKKVTTYKQPSIVSGLSVNDILNMDVDKFNKLTEKDLRKITGRLVSASNKRLRRLEKAQATASPSYVNVQRSDGDFSTKGKNINQLRAEFVRAKSFLGSKTSTVKGYKQFSKEFEKKTGVNYAEFFNDPNKARLMDRLREIDPNFDNIKYGNAYQQIDDLIERGVDFDTAWDMLQAQVTANYEEREQATINQNYTNVSR